MPMYKSSQTKIIFISNFAYQMFTFIMYVAYLFVKHDCTLILQRDLFTHGSLVGEIVFKTSECCDEHFNQILSLLIELYAL